MDNGYVYVGRPTCPGCVKIERALIKHGVSIGSDLAYHLRCFNTDRWREDPLFRDVLDKYHVQGVPFIFYLENGSIVDILRISDIENHKKTLAEMYAFFGKDRTKEAPICVADSIEFSA